MTTPWPGTAGFPAVASRAGFARKSLQLPFASSATPPEADAPEVLWGTGKPNNAVLGDVGDLYIQTDAVSGAKTLWEKRIGSATTTGWFRGTHGMYDVGDYGAVGDDATDDSAAFTAAVAAASAGGGGLVFVPPTTAAYKIGSTITVAANVHIVGGSIGGADKSRLHWTGGDSTALYFAGTEEVAGLNFTLERIEVDSANAGVGIGVRVRNFDQLILRDCAFVHLDRGCWADWGQNVYIDHTLFVLNTRGLMLGGNVSQTTTPVPGAGIRVGAFGPNALDDVVVTGCGFSQNQVDVLHNGSQYSLGGLWLAGNKFFESGGSPVAGKTFFVHLSGLKSALIERNDFESPNIRTVVSVEATGLDTDTNGPSFGVVVRHNSFLCTNGAATSKGIDIVRGQAFIDANVFECAAGAKPINLADNVTASYVGYNQYLTFVNASQPTEGFAGPITIVAAPAGGHFGYASATSFAMARIASTFGKLTSDDTGVAQLEFMLSGVRKAGFNVVGPDTIRAYDSAGTVKGQFLMGGDAMRITPIVATVTTPTEVVLVSGVDATLGNVISRSISAARVVGAPLTPRTGQRLTFIFTQTGAGAFAITWNVVFKVTWSDAGNATGKISSISFIYDGTNWCQDGAQAPYV